MKIELVVAELQGFLNVLQRLCGKSYEFSAHVISADENPGTAIANYFGDNFKYEGASQISYVQVNDLLTKYIFSNLGTVEESRKHELHWQLIEYYGLASTITDENAPFNPLVSQGALLLSVTSPRYKECVSFAVTIPGHLIITGLGHRT